MSPNSEAEHGYYARNNDWAAGTSDLDPREVFAALDDFDAFWGAAMESLRAPHSPAEPVSPVYTPTEAHGETGEAQEGRHLYDDKAGGVWSHTGVRQDCQMPECTEEAAR